MIEKLRQLKKESHITNQQIAEKSNIPESTVARIFSGKTPNPTVTTVVSMAKAMGCSAADLLNDKDDSASAATSPEHTEIRVPDGGGESAAAEGTEALADSELNRFASFVRDSLLSEDTAPHESIYEDMIQLYKDEIRKKDVWISRLFWCLAGIMMFILFVLVFDILNPTFGFVMY